MKIKFILSPLELWNLAEILKSIPITNSGLYELAQQEVVISLLFKLQRKMFCKKPKTTISLSMVECFFLYRILITVKDNYPIFVKNLCMIICNTISQKTI